MMGFQPFGDLSAPGTSHAAGGMSRRRRGGTNKMPFLQPDRITLVKKDGTVFKEGVLASVGAKTIIVEDMTLPIERGDHILRKLPSNLNEDYVVTQATCYTGHLAHWEVKYRKSGEAATSVQTIVNNISGHNARVNIHSTDNSNNQVVENSEKVFSELAEVLRQNVDHNDERDKLIRLVEEMRRGARVGTFTEKYRDFIAAAADHMTMVAPFLPALSQLL
jgi:hypothetical protein